LFSTNLLLINKEKRTKKENHHHHHYIFIFKDSNLKAGRPYSEAKSNEIYLQLTVFFPIRHGAGLHDSFKLAIKIRNTVKPALLCNISKILRASCY